MKIIYTLGLQAFTARTFDAVVEVIDPDILIDARYSRAGGRMAGMGGLQIEARHPAIYDWRGQSGLGGIRPENTTKAGLERLVKDAETNTIAFFCHCEHAMDCHRHSLIAKQIHDRVKVVHLFWAQPGQLGRVGSKDFERHLALRAAGRSQHDEDVLFTQYNFPQDAIEEGDVW